MGASAHYHGRMSLLALALLIAAPDHIDSQIKLPTVATFKDAPESSLVLTGSQ